MPDLSDVHKDIIKTINDVRGEMHACTAREVARRMNMSPDSIRFKCEQLRRAGLIDWNDMAGSLHVVEQEKPKRFGRGVRSGHLSDAS